MVKVNYPPRKNKSNLSLIFPIVAFMTIAFMLLIVNNDDGKINLNSNGRSSIIQEETKVLSKLYQDEKEILSHLMYGPPGHHQQQHESGWKPIHIFYGDDKHLAYLGRESQVKQDKLVMSILNNPKNGYFIDLAANDATNLSNTFQLEKQLDWNGICIEPNPIYWTSLSHRKCHVVGAVVGKERMAEIQFRMYPDLKKRAPSGGIEGYVDPNIPRSKEKSVDLYTVPFLEILEKFHAPFEIDYMSLDVEGAEFLVMEAFPFDKYLFKVMTIERPNQDLVNLLLKNGYLYLAANNEDGMETAWIHKSMKSEINYDGIKEVGWLVGDTKWITTTTSGKKVVNDKKKKPQTTTKKDK